MTINSYILDQDGKNIRLFITPKLIGQAAYTDETFWFSDPYYLNLKIKNGKAVIGDRDKFVIERN